MRAGDKAHQQLRPGEHEQRAERSAHRATRGEEDRDARREQPERRDLGRHAARVTSEQLDPDVLAGRGAQERERGRRRSRGDDRRDPETPARILAEPRVARGHVHDGRRHERRKAGHHELRCRLLAVVDEVGRERDREERGGREAQLPCAVGAERRHRDDREQQHQRTAQNRTVVMSTRASHTPARSSKSAKIAEAVVAAPDSIRKPDVAVGTGSAAETTASMRRATRARSGTNGRTTRAATTSSVANAAIAATSASRSTRMGGRPNTLVAASPSGVERRSASIIVPRNAATAAEISSSVGTGALLSLRPTSARIRARTASVASVASAIVARSGASNAPRTTASTPAAIAVDEMDVAM